MTEIVSSVQRVSDIIAEISAAAAEQSDGINQVNHTMAQLDQATQQNAALVEQGAAAAESLRDQSGQLAAAVSGFQLGAAAAGTASRPATPAVMAQRTISVARSPVHAPAAQAKPAAPRAAAAASTPRAKPVAPAKPRAAAPPPAGAAAPAAAPGAGDDWATI
jgi:methyl-accepting chemotaxis protein